MSSYTVEYQGNERKLAENQVKKKKGISGSTLKIIAIVTMLLDHIGAIVLMRMLQQTDIMGVVANSDINVMFVWLQENFLLYGGYSMLRMVGRIAFPIFCFLLVEGFQKTRNVNKYIFRLGIFALVSEIPFDLALTGTIYDFGYQNVFFTLFLGIVVLAIMDIVQKFKIHKAFKVILSIVAVVVGAEMANLLNTDYSAMGVVLIVALYCLRNHPGWRFGAAALILIGGGILIGAGLSEVTALVAFGLICFYNGERGLRLKYVFYLFYPVHLLLLYLISVLMGMGNIPAI